MLGRVELINKLVAKNLAIPEKEVSDVMDFFYKELSNEFQECNHPYIYVRGLGTFSLKMKSLHNRIYRLIRTRRAFRNNPLIKFRVNAFAAVTKELFKLFEIRRTFVKRIRANKKLKNGKNINDNKG